MKTILLEEHFISPGYAQGAGKPMVDNLKKSDAKGAEVLTDCGAIRIAAMDAAGIDIQVLSLSSPGVEQLEASEAVKAAREANDFLVDSIKKNPQRFAGLAVLPTAAPDKAVQELELMAKKPGIKGFIINGHIGDRYLSDQRYWPILEAAEKLSMPIYLHPTQPVAAVQNVYYKGFNPAVENMLASAGWGWHIETAVHVIRLIVSGAFDKFPRLQIIIGHMGEGLPFMIERMDGRMSRVTGLKKSIADYLRENIFYTFGGFNFTPTFLNLFMEVGADRIIFSADFPHGSMEGAKAFLEKLPISPADKEKIAHGNAEKLLKM